MNINQRLYDTRLKMVTNEYLLHPIHFFKSINLIRERKTMYPMYQTFYLKSTKPQIPYKSTFVLEDNKRFSDRMGGIMNKKAIPKINNVFLELEERIKHNNKKNADNKKRALTLENEKYANRVMTQKPRVLNTKYLEKLYKEKHDKYLEILSRPMKLKNDKKLKSEKVFNFRTKLPNISLTSTDNGFYSKYRSSTENNLETTNEQSKENSLELAEHRRHEMIHNKPGSLYA